MRERKTQVAAHRDQPRDRWRPSIVSAALVLAALGLAGCSGSLAAGSSAAGSSPPTMTHATTTGEAVRPSPTGTPIPTAASVPLTPATVEARLRTLYPGLTLESWSDDRDMGEYPQLVLRPTALAGVLDGPRIDAVLVFPTVAAREAAQAHFQPVTVSGPRGFVTWDGITSSDWVGVENVIVEVVMPGGTFGGGRHLNPGAAALPDRVAAALAGAAQLRDITS